MFRTYAKSWSNSYIVGEHKYCPHCDSKLIKQNVAKTVEELKPEQRTECEVWTRVMGYFRPVSQFNVGKKSEYNERVCLNSQKLANQVSCNQANID